MRLLALLQLIVLLPLIGCSPSARSLNIQVPQKVEEYHLQALPSPFSPLTEEEKASEWGREYLIAASFIHHNDLYRAITTLRRALVLIPPESAERRNELYYGIIYSYYVGKKFERALSTFEASPLVKATPTFPAYRNLLLILFDSYHEMDRPEQAERIAKLMDHLDNEDGTSLRLSHALRRGKEEQVAELSQEIKRYHYIPSLMAKTLDGNKSVGRAKTYNALLPGAGYLYVGQRRSAITALTLNGLFIAAAYAFFDNRYIAAGVITTAFELGWYFGGIVGGGMAAEAYNQQHYREFANKVLQQEKLFPLLMFEYRF